VKLALGLDLYRGAQLTVPVEQVRHVEQLGYHSVWTAEAYGSDALSPLAYMAAVTDRIKLATGVVQIAARTPAATAMHAMTIDALAGGGRVIIGLGVSGPQIVEGWYGQPWGSPTQRLREYVAIMRKVLAREPLTNDGTEYPLPYRGPGSTNQGKALRSILHPTDGIEIWLAAGGPVNTALTAEVADGFLPMGWGDEGPGAMGPALDKGFARRGGRPEKFEIFGGLNVVITDDIQGTIDAMKPLTAMYVGGMGSATHNYHREAMARRGFPEEAARIQELWLAGRKQEAVEAVPDEYHDDGALIGPVSRIKERWPAWTTRGLTGLTIRSDQPEAFDLIADLAGTRDTVAE
jgi:F420-dependent oxidoreductase-like protein